MQFIAVVLAGAAVATASYAPPPKDSYEAPKYEAPAPPAYAPPAYTTPEAPVYSAPAYTPAPNATASYQKPSYVTEVVSSYETYCPGPTMITHGASTYTVTEATTLTITNCPCTVTKPAYTSVVTACSTCAPVYKPTTPVMAPSMPASYPAPAPSMPPYQPPAGPVPPPYHGNNTTPYSPTKPTGTGSYTTAPPSYTGAANKASFGVAGLLAAAGLVAAL